MRLCTNLLEALDGVHNAVLQGPERDAQLLGDTLVVVLVDAILGVVAARSAVGRKTVPVLWEVLANDLRNLLVAEVAGRDEEALVGRSLLLDGVNVGEREVAHINPQEGAGLWDLILGLALHDVANTLVRGVERVKRVEVVDNRAEDERRAHGREREVWLLLLDEVPGGALGKGLAGAVAVGWVLWCLLFGDRVPVSLGVGVAGTRSLATIDNRGERRCDDDMLNARCGFLDALQDSGGANDGWVEKLLLHIGDIEVEGRCGVDDGVERWVRLDGLVEGAFLCNVLDNHVAELVTGLWVGLLEVLALLC